MEVTASARELYDAAVVIDALGGSIIRRPPPPVDGKANAALCAFIARRLKIPASRVAVVRGQTSRDKVVRVEGVAQDALRAALVGQ